MSYSYSVEGALARYTNWDVLVSQIMANLNILETHLGITPTQLYSLDPDKPKVFCWLAKNGVDIKDRIDSVRASIGFDNFEWRTGFNPTDGTQYMSFDDLAMMARAVGIPGARIPKSEIDVPYMYANGSSSESIISKQYSSTYKANPVNIQTRDAAQVYDINFSLSKYEFSLNLPNVDGYSFLNNVTFRVREDQWKAAVGFSKLRIAYSFNLYSIWNKSGNDIDAFQDISMAQIFQFGLPVDPEITGFGAPTMGYTTSIPSTGDEFKKALYLLPNPFIKVDNSYVFSLRFNPEERLGDFGEYFVYDPIIGDSAVSPQLAFLANANSKKSKRWDFEVNHIANHAYVSGYDYGEVIYRVTKADETPLTVPQLDIVFTPDGNNFTVMDTVNGDGVVSGVMDWIQTSATYFFGCVINPSALSLPSDIPLNALSEYYQYGATPNTIGQQTDNGVIMKRAAIYAETELTPPFIWMAARR